MSVSVVVPVLDEEGILEELHRRVRSALEGIPHEIVFVDDGSTDRSTAVIEELAARGPGIVLVQLSRNFGMEAAMSAGLDHARGDHVVLMHADLQDPPELIPEMLRLAEEAHCLLHCADAEPYGLALVEALAAGRPVVAPDAAGPREIVADGAGQLYPPGDPAAAAAALRYVLRDAGAPAAARARAEAHFAVEASAARFAAALEAIR